MLQIDHVYEFFYAVVFNKNFEVWSLPGGVPKLGPVQSDYNFILFKPNELLTKKIFFYDQEPLLKSLTQKYVDHYLHFQKYTLEELKEQRNISEHDHQYYLEDPNRAYKLPACMCVSEHSSYVDELVNTHNMKKLYYFFHGFAALDWYRGYYALNYNKQIVKQYDYDFITFNRLITEDRSYRIYFVSQLAKHNLIDKGLVSFGVTDDDQCWRDEAEQNPNSKLSQHAQKEIWDYLPDLPDRLIIDQEYLPGSASADIPRENDTLWHIVTETVFYYDKLHLTEKIFKPIVSKQPFMLLAAPGNLAYLKSYGFKTFDSVIDESYDTIQDPDARVDAVVAQMKWYSELSDSDKLDVMRKLEPVVEYNFHHFYGKFKEIITDELLTNCQKLFKDINYTTDVDFSTIRNILLN